MKSKYKVLLACGGLFVLAGCQQPGADLGANVYQADQVNQSQNAEIINILSLSPAKVEVSNAQDQKDAQVVGGVLGALTGGLVGSQVSGGTLGTGLGGAAIGGVAGAAAGTLVPGQVLVDGVTIGYTQNGNIHTSTQVGKMCQFRMGQALVVVTKANETRVQPNATCPSNNG